MITQWKCDGKVRFAQFIISLLSSGEKVNTYAFSYSRSSTRGTYYAHTCVLPLPPPLPVMKKIPPLPPTRPIFAPNNPISIIFAVNVLSVFL